MLPLIPYKRLIIESSLTPEQAADALRQIVAPPSLGFRFWSRPSHDFEGAVLADSFKISRAIRYRNSFLPILHGRFIRNGSGTLVDVRMMMHPLVIVFLLFWCSVVLIACFGVAADLLRSGQWTDKDWIPFIMIAFVYLLTFFSFGFEAQKATSVLNDIFNSGLLPTNN